MEIKPKKVSRKKSRNIDIMTGIVSGIVRDHSSSMTMRQMAVLLNVYAGQNEPTVRDIARALRINKPAVSRALDRLSQLGYVEREKDESDFRSILVKIMPEGMEMLAKIDDINI